jgi:hypothetical protein
MDVYRQSYIIESDTGVSRHTLSLYRCDPIHARGASLHFFLAALRETLPNPIDMSKQILI